MIFFFKYSEFENFINCNPWLLFYYYRDKSKKQWQPTWTAIAIKKLIEVTTSFLRFPAVEFLHARQLASFQ